MLIHLFIFKYKTVNFLFCLKIGNVTKETEITFEFALREG
jgi:hypothetical protein